MRHSYPVLFSLLLILLPAAAYSLPDNFADLPDEVQALLLEFSLYSEQAEAQWGEEFISPGSESFVKYLDDYHSRATVDFDRGFIRVETREADKYTEVLSHAIVSILLTPADPGQIDIYTAREIGLTGKPFLLGRVRDHEGKDVRYEWRATRYATHLVKHRLREVMTSAGKMFRIDIPMVSDHKDIAAGQYSDLVNRSAREYQLSPALIMAVIHTESSFNPFAVSPSGAYGLMQVMPRTAGRDFFQKIRKKEHTPGRQYLFKPANNIDAGSGYLSILRDNYLAGIKHPLSMEYCMIAAYNGGAGQLLRSFHRDRKKAVNQINSMTPQQVFRHIVRRHPKAETRRYLEKVTKQQKHYQTAT